MQRHEIGMAHGTRTLPPTVTPMQYMAQTGPYIPRISNLEDEIGGKRDIINQERAQEAASVL